MGSRLEDGFAKLGNPPSSPISSAFLQWQGDGKGSSWRRRREPPGSSIRCMQWPGTTHTGWEQVQPAHALIVSSPRVMPPATEELVDCQRVMLLFGDLPNGWLVLDVVPSRAFVRFDANTACQQQIARPGLV